MLSFDAPNARGQVEGYSVHPLSGGTMFTCQAGFNTISHCESHVVGACCAAANNTYNRAFVRVFSLRCVGVF